MGIEPTISAWKANVLPLHYTRMMEIAAVLTRLRSPLINLGNGARRRHKLHIVRFRASTEAHSFRCVSSPQKVTLGFSAQLQAPSRRKAVATNLLRAGDRTRLRAP